RRVLFRSKRTIRNGHGFAQVGAMHPPHFRREKLRVWVYGLVLPLLFLLGLFVSGWLSVAVLALYALSFWKTWRGLKDRPMAVEQAALLTLAKIPSLWGMLTYFRRRQRGDDMPSIEYKVGFAMTSALRVGIIGAGFIATLLSVADMEWHRESLVVVTGHAHCCVRLW